MRVKRSTLGQPIVKHITSIAVEGEGRGMTIRTGMQLTFMALDHKNSDSRKCYMFACYINTASMLLGHAWFRQHASQLRWIPWQSVAAW